MSAVASDREPGATAWAASSSEAVRALVAVLAAVAVTVTLMLPASSGPDVAVYAGDTEVPVSEIVASVRAAAGRAGLEVDRELHVKVVDWVPGKEGELIGGWQQGDTAWVRASVANPTRTLVHEVSHAFTGYDHGEVWRAVYLDAVGQVLGAEAADQEHGRIRWVYDKCYLDDSC